MALPTVTALSPQGGPSAGGTLVKITGTNFANVQSVNFGTGSPLSSTPAVKLTAEFATKALLEEAAKGEKGGKVVGEGVPVYGFWVEGATVIYAYAPPALAVNASGYLSGTFNVTVTNKSGETSAAAEANGYGYWGPHTVAHSGQHLVETIPLGLKATSEVQKVSYLELAESTSENLPLYGDFASCEYIGVAVNLDEIKSGTEGSVIVEHSQDGKNWQALPGAVEDSAKSLKTGALKANINPVSQANKASGPQYRIKLKNDAAATSGFAGQIVVTGAYSATYDA